MKKIILIALAGLFSIVIQETFAQNKSQIQTAADSLKAKALLQFKKEDYNAAVGMMEEALKLNPKDPEIYYYLGYFNHYRAYDSRPLTGYNPVYSEKIFAYLDKAIELRPDYGNARYFYGAECSANAFLAMQRKSPSDVSRYYKKAFDKGAFPPWLLEFGRNFLNSCEQDAIVFTGGNNDFDVCMYLMLHENMRKDITLIPIGNIDRPWYVKLLKNGLPGVIRKVNISLTYDQIDDIHPFKWDTTLVEIPVPAGVASLFKEAGLRTMKWQINPDLVSNRDKQEDQAKKRTFLSPQRGILLTIIESCKWERPVFISNAANSELNGGLEQFLQNRGLLSKVLPVPVAGTPDEDDITQLEKLISAPNFKDFRSVLNSDMPRISGILMLYHISCVKMAYRYAAEGDKLKARETESFYKIWFDIGFNKEQTMNYFSMIHNLIL